MSLPKLPADVCRHVLASALILTAIPAFGQDCDTVYDSCRRQLELHATCAVQQDAELVKDAAAIFELRQRMVSAIKEPKPGPDPSILSLEQTLTAVLQGADRSLREAGVVERVLIGDLHWRHAERLRRLLEAPRRCDERSLARLEMACEAGVGEVVALTRTGWPAEVATCVDGERLNRLLGAH